MNSSITSLVEVYLRSPEMLESISGGPYRNEPFPEQALSNIGQILDQYREMNNTGRRVTQDFPLVLP